MTSAQTTQITLHRSHEYFAKLRGYRVRIDGQDAGPIRDGQTSTFEVSPGHHTVEIRCDWCRSNTLEVDTTSGPVELDCGSAMQQFPKIFLAIVYCTIWYDRCLYLRPTESSQFAAAA